MIVIVDLKKDIRNDEDIETILMKALEIAIKL